MIEKPFKILILLSVVVFFLLQASTLTNYCDNQKNGDPYNGYCDNWDWWVPGYISNDTWMTPAPQYITGKMVFYAPNVMRATAEYRGIDYEEYGCIGGVSLMSPRDIGKKVWIEIEKNMWRGPYCVVDSARRGDMYSIIVHRDEVVEVEYELAEQLGMVETRADYSYKVIDWYRDVNVFVQDCLGNCLDPNVISGEPVNYSEWFLENVEYVKYRESNLQPSDNFSYWRLNGGGKFYFNDFMYKTCQFNYIDVLEKLVQIRINYK